MSQSSFFFRISGNTDMISLPSLQSLSLEHPDKEFFHLDEALTQNLGSYGIRINLYYYLCHYLHTKLAPSR